MMEKEALLPSVAEDVPSKPQRKPTPLHRWVIATIFVTFFLLLQIQPNIPFSGPRHHHDHHRHGGGKGSSPSKSQCAQPPALFPNATSDSLADMWRSLSSDAYLQASAGRLSGAVQVRTESFDDLGPIGEDPRWEAMPPFADYLARTFPLVHERLQLEKVNTHGLLYTWAGSDAGLKPLVLMAHMDVVPVPDNTVPEWTHPPFSGHFDGKYVWGRGASDCKNQLIGTLEAIEALLAAGFAPRRTVVLSFGFDEEVSGPQGAGHLAPAILERYGAGGVAAIVDEGAGFLRSWGTTFATPGTAEKGYTDVRVTVAMPGGHSSVPPAHTSIGVLSEFITLVEAETYPTELTEENPYLGLMQCGAAHSDKKEFPRELKKLLEKRAAHETCRAEHHHGGKGHHRNSKKKTDRLAVKAAELGGPAVRYLMQTSQAVDVISGGVKINALPEQVTVKINHRINVGDEPETVWNRLEGIARDVAKKHKLTVHAFENETDSDSLHVSTGKKGGSAGSITLTTSKLSLRVAPVAPSDAGAEKSPFGVLAGTTRALYGLDVIVAPGMATGNTDTRYYWDLTSNIFRFGPGFDADDQDGMGRIHTVDERISIVNHVNTVKWFSLFIRNMDEADLEG